MASKTLIARPPTLDPLDTFLDDSTEFLDDATAATNQSNIIHQFHPAAHIDPFTTRNNTNDLPPMQQFTALNPKKFNTPQASNISLDVSQAEAILKDKRMKRCKCPLLERRGYAKDLRVERPKSPPHMPVLVRGAVATGAAAAAVSNNNYSFGSFGNGKRSGVQLKIRNLEAHAEAESSNAAVPTETKKSWMDYLLNFDESETQYANEDLAPYQIIDEDKGSYSPESASDQQYISSTREEGTYDPMEAIVFEDEDGDFVIGEARGGISAV